MNSCVNTTIWATSSLETNASKVKNMCAVNKQVMTQAHATNATLNCVNIFLREKFANLVKTLVQVTVKLTQMSFESNYMF